MRSPNRGVTALITQPFSRRLRERSWRGRPQTRERAREARSTPGPSPIGAIPRGSALFLLTKIADDWLKLARFRGYFCA